MTGSIFAGTLPALMTPCTEDRSPDFDALVRKAEQLREHGMGAMIYAGSMGDWPLLTDAERMQGVERLVAAGIPVIVGTGAVNTRTAVALAEHAQQVGAKGLMVIPRVLSRGTVLSAQKAHFSAILSAAPELQAVIYNSPYYGFATRADLFFELRKQHANLVGFKEFGGTDDLRYAAENITSADDDVQLAIGVDTSVFHGYVNCGAVGAITGIGNVLPVEVLHLTNLCVAAPAARPRRVTGAGARAGDGRARVLRRRAGPGPVLQVHARAARRDRVHAALQRDRRAHPQPVRVRHAPARALRRLVRRLEHAAWRGPDLQALSSD